MLTERFTRYSLRSRVVTVISILGIISVFAYDWNVSPKLNYLQAATAHEHISENIEKKIRSLKNKLKIKKKEVQQLSKGISKIEVRLLTDKQYSESIKLLQSIAVDHGCHLESLTFMNDSRISPNNNKDTDISITKKRTLVEISASYSSIVSFLGHFTKACPVDIKDLSIRSLDNRDVLLCKLNIISYNKNQPSLLIYD